MWMNNINIIINMTILKNIDSDEDILEYFDIVQAISVNIEIYSFPKQVFVVKKNTLWEFQKSDLQSF